MKVIIVPEDGDSPSRVESLKAQLKSTVQLGIDVTTYWDQAHHPYDISAVLLTDGQWYAVEDVKTPNGYLSFIQYPVDRNHPIMVNVNFSDIKAIAYYGIPEPHVSVTDVAVEAEAEPGHRQHRSGWSGRATES